MGSNIATLIFTFVPSHKRTQVNSFSICNVLGSMPGSLCCAWYISLVIIL